jgi:phosphoglycerate dehydrogenase-like enzyme
MRMTGRERVVTGAAMAGTFRVGLTDDFLLPDGTLAFPGYDLGVLRTSANVELVRLRGGEELEASQLAGIDVLVSVPMTAALTKASLRLADRLAGVVRVGVGCDDVDLPACTEAGVAVVVPADAVRRPTAIAALTLLLALATRLVEKDRMTREGPEAWHRRAGLRGRNLAGQVLGLVGCGSIGSDLAGLVRPLGMRVLAFDPMLSVQDARRLEIEPASLETVLSRSDYLSIHCPLTAETRHLFDARRFQMMKPGARLINTARGGIVDQEALLGALRSGHLAGAGLDVFDPEPLPDGHPLLSEPGVILSAHALNWTEELDTDLAAQNVAAVIDLLSGRVPHKVVNGTVVTHRDFARKLDALARRTAAATEGSPA